MMICVLQVLNELLNTEHRHHNLLIFLESLGSIRDVILSALKLLLDLERENNQ